MGQTQRDQPVVVQVLVHDPASHHSNPPAAIPDAVAIDAGSGTKSLTEAYFLSAVAAKYLCLGIHASCIRRDRPFIGLRVSPDVGDANGPA